MTDEMAAIGQRIAAARIDAGLTQADLASRAQLERSALAKIETGKRRVSALELARIADAVDQRIEWLLSDAPIPVVSRRNRQAPDEPSPALDRALERVAREVEFVQETSDVLTLVDAPALGMPSTMRDAEELGAETRDLLQLSPDEPATQLSRRVAELGLLVFSLPLGSESADGGCLLLRTGGVAVINGDRQVGRRRLTLVHELGHYLFADEFSVDWRVAEDGKGGKEARIDRFARAVLLPAATISERWRRLAASDGSRVAAVRLASEYRVDMSTLARRLVELGVTSREEAGTVRHVRTTRADILDYDLLVAHDVEPVELPQLYEHAILKLFRAEVISGARAIELLLDTWDETDLPDLPTLPQGAIWQFIHE